jgi:hypothetical protein
MRSFAESDIDLATSVSSLLVASKLLEIERVVCGLAGFLTIEIS